MSSTFTKEETRRNFIILSVVLVFFVFVFNVTSPEENLSNVKAVRIAGVKVQVDVVATPEDRARGLSGRESLGEDEGMLFVFYKPSKNYFWMQGMLFSIDIIWINENREIIFIKKDAKPEDFLSTFGPDEDSMYVLEVVSGFSDKNNIKVGDKVQFTF